MAQPLLALDHAVEHQVPAWGYPFTPVVFIVLVVGVLVLIAANRPFEAAAGAAAVALGALADRFIFRPGAR